MLIPLYELVEKKISTHNLSDEIGVYQTYLISTDYIPLKIAEGVATKEEYAKELMYRQICREEIAKLKQ